LSALFKPKHMRHVLIARFTYSPTDYKWVL